MNDRNFSFIPSFIAMAGLLFVFYGNFHLWKTELINYDLINDYLSARYFLSDFLVPHYGSVSSFGAYNPPGISLFFIPGIILFPHEPALVVYTAIFIVSFLFVVGLRFLMVPKFGNKLFLLSIGLILLSSVGWYYLGNLRPRAHPLFLVWCLFFYERWLNEKNDRDFVLGTIVLSYGFYWMLELAPLAIGLLVSFLLFRKIPKIRTILMSGAFALLIWVPYLNFQYERDFKDLKVLLVEQEPVINFGKSFFETRKEYGLKRTFGGRAHEIEGVDSDEFWFKTREEYKEHNKPKFVESDTINLSDKLIATIPQTYAPRLFLLIYIVLSLLLLFLWAMQLRSFGSTSHDFQKALFIRLGVIFIISWSFNFVLTFHDPHHVVERRFLWIWPLWVLWLVSAISVMKPYFVKKHYEMRFLKPALAACFIALIAITPHSVSRIKSMISHSFLPAPQSEIHDVMDWIAQRAGDSKELRIGYDVPFLAWLVSVNKINSNSRIGLQTDLFFEFRYGISNLNRTPFSVSREDDFRIVELKPTEVWRSSYLDLREFPPMKTGIRFENHLILIQP